jgi:hypothetical protein
MRFPHWLTRLAPALAGVLPACTQVVREEDLFHPERYAPLPGDQHRRAVEITSADGAVLRGWLLHAPGNRRTVIWFYGNAETAQSAAGTTYWLSRTLACNVLTVDYRGYGASDGEPSFLPMLEDAEALYDALADLVPEHVPIVAYGRSIGGVFATHLAARRPLATLVLGCPPAGAEDAVAAMQEQAPIPLRWLLRLRADESLTDPELQPVRVIEQVVTPILVIHGDRDTTIPIEHGERTHAASAAADKRWLPLPGRGHSDWDLFDPPVRDALESFLDTHAGG